MSYFVRYLSESLRKRRNKKENDAALHGPPANWFFEHLPDEDDGSLESSSSALIPVPDLNYGSTTREEEEDPDEQKSKTLGFTDDYVDWSHSKESIIMAFVAFLLYVIVAIAGYSYIFEDWPILDSMYFAVAVFTTVGYGDLAPSTDSSRLFTIAFSSSGIIILGVFLGIIGTRLFELREQRVKEKLSSAREKVLQQFDAESTVDEKEPAKSEENKPTLSQDVWSILKIEAPMIFALVLVASPVVYLEGWDVIMGFYWMFVTGTTIGFGDLSPTHPWTKVISIIYLPLAAAVFGELLAQIAGAYIERSSDKMEHDFLQRALTRGDIEQMDLEKDGRVKAYEFLSYMLVTMQKAEQEEIDEIIDLFRKLDKDKTGYLSQNDLSKRYNLEGREGLRRKNAYRQLKV